MKIVLLGILLVTFLFVSGCEPFVFDSVCTDELRICPGGFKIGRVGPDCEFEICPEIETKCFIEPEAGPCKAMTTKYYFDQEEGICKEFIWGGCDGIVPFNKLEDCRFFCEDGTPWNEAITILNSGQVKEVFQSHSLHVMLTLEDGTTISTKEPKIDDVFDEVRKCGNLCRDIIIAIE